VHRHNQDEHLPVWPSLVALLLLLAAAPARAESVTPTNGVTRYVVVRKGPTATSAPVGQLRPTESAETIESAGRWFKIRLSTGSEGYLSKAWVTESGESGTTTKKGPPILYPDAGMTPGATNPSVTQATIDQTICKSGWAQSVRPPAAYTDPLKARQLVAYGDTVRDVSGQCVPHSSSPRCYEEDHLISLELGGDPRNPKNLWPEPYHTNPGAKQKDTVENFLNKQVCTRAMTLDDAQRQIATDWYAVFLSIHP